MSPRGVAQPGSAPALGAGCRRFESSRPDQRRLPIDTRPPPSPKIRKGREALPGMKYIDHVRADVLTWPGDLREAFMAQARVKNDWSQSEAELRQWIDFRCESVAKEPIVVNRHHLTPATPQRDDNRVWPRWAIYCGRIPTPVRDGDEGWRFARALGNKWRHQDYPDALERYRTSLKTAIREHREGKFCPVIDAIRSILPRHALVCSCAKTPWTPTAANPREPLGATGHVTAN
jgi:hypothetical protein